MTGTTVDCFLFQQPPPPPPLNNGGRGQQQHLKRPSFAWLQPLHSPRKGLFTIVVIVGSFLATWLPTSARDGLIRRITKFHGVL